jgi:hypothetical protein
MNENRIYALSIAPETANTIRRQLHSGGQAKVWSWGAHAWRYGVTGESETEYPYPFLRFRVRGFKLKGIVQITYDTGSDTYYAEFFKGNSKVAYKKIENLYCDDLTDVIDREVETDNDQSKEYAQKVKTATYNI